jgi:hypothetical protein
MGRGAESQQGLVVRSLSMHRSTTMAPTFLTGAPLSSACHTLDTLTLVFVPNRLPRPSPPHMRTHVLKTACQTCSHPAPPTDPRSHPPPSPPSPPTPTHPPSQDGVPETGVSVAFTVLKCDAGPILAQQRVPLTGEPPVDSVGRCSSMCRHATCDNRHVWPGRVSQVGVSWSLWFLWSCS